MLQKRRNPTGVKRQGFDLEMVSDAVSEINTATATSFLQDHRAATLLARRYHLPLPTAALVAELAGIGGGS